MTEARGLAPGFDLRDVLIHEDAVCLVFNKPAGLAVQAGSGLTDTLESLAAAAFSKSKGRAPKLVHRLDRGTSGVILMARTKPAAAFFSAAFSGRSAQKTYCAVVCGGAPEPRDGVVRRALKKHRDRSGDRMATAQDTDPGAQVAVSAFATLSASPLAALVRLAPETGRMHQLRVHMASIGRPIAGDDKYGGLFRIGAVAIPRLMLHAARLELPHPDGGMLRLDAPLPDDFRAAARALGLDPDALVD